MVRVFKSTKREDIVARELQKQEIYLKAYYGEGNIPESGKAKEKKEEK